LNILFAGIFALVFLMGAVSAAISVFPATVNLNQFGDSQTFTITNLDTLSPITVPLTSQTITSLGKTVTISFSESSVNLLASGSAQVTAKIVTPIDTSFPLGTYSANYNITASPSVYTTLILNFENLPTKYRNDGKMDVSLDNINVEKGYGEDNSWFPLDEISAEITVENNNDNSGDKIRNIVVEWGLYNTQDGKWIIKEKESKFNLNEGDEKTLTLNFKLDSPDDFKDSGDYVFYAWATGENEAFSDNSTSVNADPEEIEIVLESDFVTFDKGASIFDANTDVQCDSEVQLLAEAWNIGEDDQTDVYVIVYNKELGLNEKVEIGDVDAFDNSDFTFTFQLPEGVKEKLYYLELTVYDDSDDVYQNENDDKAVFSVPLNVQGTCSLAEALVTAVLESGGQAGKQLVVRATIVNDGDKTTTYLLNAAGYAEWASLATLDKNSLTLDAGKSEDVLISFDVNKEALGNNLFNLEVLSNNELVVSQPVQVEITKKKFGITGNFFSGDNKYIWGIGALNLILIILIIVIAVRISRKK
ncbi:MAG: putative S-layer protein, partial [Nanoarchaeota archaeon]